jgi:hypothetical protein
LVLFDKIQSLRSSFHGFFGFSFSLSSTKCSSILKPIHNVQKTTTTTTTMTHKHQETTSAKDDPLLRSFSNPQIVEYLTLATNATSMAMDILKGAEGIGKFAASTDPVVFVRPSPLNWENEGEVFDLLASFLGGLPPVNPKQMETLLEQCSTLNRDTWAQRRPWS